MVNQLTLGGANVDGLRFAHSHGFVEVSRYLPPEDDDPFITLRLQ
jgi:hypothetical protein